MLHPFIPFLQGVEGVDDGLHGFLEQSGQLATDAQLVLMLLECFGEDLLGIWKLRRTGA